MYNVVLIVLLTLMINIQIVNVTEINLVQEMEVLVFVKHRSVESQVRTLQSLT